MATMLGWTDRLLARLIEWLSGKELGSAIPSLDLHGLGVREALRETEEFLKEAQQRGIARVRIVYGKGRHSPGGRGVLRDVVPRWLARDGQKWVESFSPCLEPLGQEGSVEVKLRPRERGSQVT